MPCTNRRQFLVTTGATLAAPAPAGAANAHGRYTIDCQSHLFVPEVVRIMEQRTTPPRVFRKGNAWFLQVKDWVRAWKPEYADLKLKLASMDEAGIHLTVLSSNDPGPELFGSDGVKIARIIHDYLAQVVEQHPSRFIGLATLPLQDIEASLTELDRCVNKLALRGVLLYSNIDGHFPDESRFRPLFARAEQLDVPILLHPPYPVMFGATSEYGLTGGLGLMFDTTIALCRIILAGILDDHPRLKLVCPHAGGTLPYVIGRIDHQTMVMKRVQTRIRKAPSEYLRNIYLDAVAPIPMAVRYAYDFVGPERLLYSSDHPWVQPELITQTIKKLNLPAADEEKIFAGNAKRLFRL